MTLDPKTWWYVSRATGFVSWTLLAVSVLWGLFATNKTLARSTAPAWVLDLHRHVGGLAVVFVAVHVAVLPLDTYTDWGWSDLFVPMTARWHPLAIAFGIVALYLLLAVEVTSLLQRRMPREWWRRVHILSFPLYVVASIHLLAAGTDAANQIAQGLVIVASTLIAFLTGVRLLGVASPRAAPRSRTSTALPPRHTPTGDGTPAVDALADR
jgi:DMSO/TMAO reductase YedYZ heme-binding membrane subunit